MSTSNAPAGAAEAHANGWSRHSWSDTPGGAGWIVQLAHFNITVPKGTLDLAAEFYGGTLGLQRVPVPEAQKDILAWFNLPNPPNSPYPPQQIHVAYPSEPAEISLETSRRHPCFKLASPAALQMLQKRIFAHYKVRQGSVSPTDAGEGIGGKESAPVEADEPGKQNSGAQGKEYPDRFFARDYANNRLEFSL